MAKFNINPTLINSLTTLYVSKDGDDGTGDGSAGNPYASLAKATDIGTAGNNIVIGNGLWEEQRTLNSRAFKYWGCGDTVIKRDSTEYKFYNGDQYNYMYIFGGQFNSTQNIFVYFKYCTVENLGIYTNSACSAEFCLLKSCVLGSYNGLLTNIYYINNIFLNCSTGYGGSASFSMPIKNNIIIGNNLSFIMYTGYSYNLDYNNYTTFSIPTTNGVNVHSINDTSTGQTTTDYFNNTSIDDYTAKAGSLNIQAGAGGILSKDIGFSQGYSKYAADTEFTIAGGATLQNVSLSSGSLIITHTNMGVAGVSGTSFTLDSSASADDDYYNGLFVHITNGIGIGQVREITDYDGVSKIATVAAWNTNPDVGDIYALTGFFESADVDLGRVIRVKKNHLHASLQSNGTGKYEKYISIFNSDAINDTPFYVFAMKYSGANNLVDKDWQYFQSNGFTKHDGTYGDGDDNYVIADGRDIYVRYYKIKFRLLN
jgi:hypothetical protein